MSLFHCNHSPTSALRVGLIQALGGSKSFQELLGCFGSYLADVQRGLGYNTRRRLLGKASCSPQSIVARSRLVRTGSLLVRPQLGSWRVAVT